MFVSYALMGENSCYVTVGKIFFGVVIKMYFSNFTKKIPYVTFAFIQLFKAIICLFLVIMEFLLRVRRGCPKAYHPSCVNRDEAFFKSKGRWNCGTCYGS